jgi:hypothetical protein
MGTLVTPKPTSMIWDSATNRFVSVGEATESPVQGLLDNVFLDRNVFNRPVQASDGFLYNADNGFANMVEKYPTRRSDGSSGIQTSQEMFDETYQDALVADALDSMEQEGQFSSGNATLDMLNQAIADKEAGVIKTKGTEQGVVEMTPEESDAAYDVTIKGLTDKLVGMGVPVSDLPFVNEDDEDDDKEPLTFGDLLNDLLKPVFPPFNPRTVGPFILGGKGDDTGVDPGDGVGDGVGDETGDTGDDTSNGTGDTGDDTGVGTATPTVPPVAPAEPVPDTAPSTEPDGNLEPDLDPTPDPTVVSDEIVTDDQAVVTIPEIIKPKSTESKRQLFDIVTSATPITESILFSPQFVDLDNIQLGMFDAFLKASGGK